MALQLTPEQKEKLLAAHVYLLAQIQDIIEEYNEIIGMLQVWALSIATATKALPLLLVQSSSPL